MSNFTKFRTPNLSLADSSDQSDSVESTFLPVVQSPVNSPGFVLSSINSSLSEKSHSDDASLSQKAPKHKHKLTKARAAALAIPLGGSKVSSEIQKL